MRPGRIVVAIDSFKGSLTSEEAGNSAAAGIKRAIPGCEVIVSPLADGGEGTAAALAGSLHGTMIKVKAHDPLGRVIGSEYGIIPGESGQTAVIEMAAAAGITLLSHDELDVKRASTYGVGELILDAINRGIRDFIICVGGSATNDGGAGMLEALGVGLLGADSEPIRRGAAGLRDLTKITLPEVSHLPECRFRVACDVTNPLLGKKGCAAVFAPQKGAEESEIPLLDAWMKNFADRAVEIFPAADPEYPGSGAAGGLGFALRTFLGAELLPGAGLVIGASGLEEKIKSADIVVTGEGRIDAQTAMGKAPSEVAKLAKRYSKPCVALSGCVGAGAGDCNAAGIDAFFPILREVCGLEAALDRDYAAKNLADTAEQVFRLICAV